MGFLRHLVIPLYQASSQAQSPRGFDLGVPEGCPLLHNQRRPPERLSQPTRGLCRCQLISARPCFPRRGWRVFTRQTSATGSLRLPVPGADAQAFQLGFGASYFPCAPWTARSLTWMCQKSSRTTQALELLHYLFMSELSPHSG